MDSQKFFRLAVDAVVRYYNANDGKACNTLIGVDDVYVVWSCKTLGNNKALLSTTIPDGMYYEITYNGAKNEIYFDAYKRWENQCVKVDNDA